MYCHRKAIKQHHTVVKMINKVNTDLNVTLHVSISFVFTDLLSGKHNSITVHFHMHLTNFVYGPYHTIHATIVYYKVLNF